MRLAGVVPDGDDDDDECVDADLEGDNLSKLRKQAGLPELLEDDLPSAPVGLSGRTHLCTQVAPSFNRRCCHKSASGNSWNLSVGFDKVTPEQRVQ